MNLEQETKFLLEKYKLKANKGLGQNFLIDEIVLDEIVEKADVNENDLIIEIGPGLGTLTAKLAEKAKKVVAIELDQNMINVLTERFSLYQNVELIHGDILKTDLKKIIDGETSVKVVANLPYYITTPIVMKLLEEELTIKSITVMVQKEVGERFCARPGSKDYGAITVSINYYTDAKIVIDVPRTSFMPAPDVDSCVVMLNVKQNHIELKNKKHFFTLVKLAFSKRRKNIGNSLIGDGLGKDDVKQVLSKLKIDIQKRAENLSLEEFAEIANYEKGEYENDK